MKKNTKFLLIDILALVLFLLLVEPSITGKSLHEWGGLLIGVIILIHLILHWQWFVVVSKKFFTTNSTNRARYFFDVILLAVFLLIIWSGVMISRTILAGFSFGNQNVWKAIHYLSTDLALVMLAIKLGLHWNWIKNATLGFLGIRKKKPQLNDKPKTQQEGAIL